MYPHTEITQKIIAAAIEVHQHLGPAYHESIYQRALAYEMTLQNISFEQEKEISVSYKDTPVGKYRLDFLVEEKVIVELKAVEALNDVHLSQVLSYLSATSRKIGLLLNFGQSRLVDGIKRVIQ